MLPWVLLVLGSAHVLHTGPANLCSGRGPNLLLITLEFQETQRLACRRWRACSSCGATANHFENPDACFWGISTGALAGRMNVSPYARQLVRLRCLMTDVDSSEPHGHQWVCCDYHSYRNHDDPRSESSKLRLEYCVPIP